MAYHTYHDVQLTSLAEPLRPKQQLRQRKVTASCPQAASTPALQFRPPRAAGSGPLASRDRVVGKNKRTKEKRLEPNRIRGSYVSFASKETSNVYTVGVSGALTYPASEENVRWVTAVEGVIGTKT